MCKEGTNTSLKFLKYLNIVFIKVGKQCDQGEGEGKFSCDEKTDKARMRERKDSSKKVRQRIQVG